MGNTLSQGIPVSDALVMSVVGFAIVFFVLVVLMAVIKILRGILESLDAAKAKPANAAPVAAAAPAPAAPAKDPNMVPAKGSVGEIMLFVVDEKSGVIIMAIVADELKAPLNELRFLSIREKK
ncbi:MAG: OadG family protein [Planctomycetes bacterium]|nr:OadG family protein [Planctomycetota bacterium]